MRRMVLSRATQWHKEVWLVLDRDPTELTGPAGAQLQILEAAGLQPMDPSRADRLLCRSQLVVDALVGYGLRGEVQGRVAELIELCNRRSARVLSLDVPSGIDATTGIALGSIVCPERTLTLALPKTGLHSIAGDHFLADIGIPPEVYEWIGLSFDLPFGSEYWVRIESVPEDGK